MNLLLNKRPGDYDPDADEQNNPVNKSGGGDSSWSPDGYDEDNSDYDQDNPTSKARNNVNPAAAEIGAMTNDGNKTKTSDAENKLSGSAGLAGSDVVGRGFPISAGATPVGVLSKFRAMSTKKKAVSGGGIAGVATLLFMMFFMSIGPLKLVHVGSLLERFHFSANQDFNDNNSMSLMRYIRKGPQSTRLGRTFSRVAENLDLKITDNTGLRAVYGKGTRRLIGYEILDPDKASGLLKDIEKDGYDTKGTLGDGNFDTQGNKITPKGNNFIPVKEDTFRRKRGLQRLIIEGADIDGVAATLSSRLLSKYAGVGWAPLQNLRRKGTDKAVDFYFKVREDMAKRNSKGISPGDVTPAGTDADNDGKIDTDTTSANTPEADASRAGADAVDVTKNIDPASPDYSVKVDAAKANVNAKLKGAAAAAAIVGVICAVRSVGDAAENTQYLNVILPMIRLSTMYMSVASQIKSGENLSSDEIAVFAESLNDPVTGLGALSAAPFVASTNGPAPAGTKYASDLDPDLKPGKLGEKPEFFGLLDSIPGIGTICGIDTLIGGLPIIKQISDISSFGVDKILGVVGLSQEKLISSLVNVLAGSSINFYAVGAELGNYLMYGGRLAANVLNISTGARELSSDEEIALLNEEQQKIIKQNQSKSFFARMFDVNDVDSLAGRAVINSPVTINSLVNKFSQIRPSSLLSSLIPSAKAGAINGGYFDYGFPAYGHSLAEQDDPRIQDPYANAEIVEADIADIDAKFGDCFSKRIDPTTLDLIDNELARRDVTAAKCNDKTSEQLLRYRFYLPARVTETTLACYGGDRQSCDTLGVQAGSENDTADATTANSTEPVAVEDLNCEGLLTLDSRYKYSSKGAIELDAEGMPVKASLRPYSSRVKEVCAQRKAECISGNMPYTQKALCEGFKFSETFYGASYGRFTALTQEWYGLKAKRNPEHNAEGWSANWRPGLNEDNLFGCTGLITISVFKAYDPTIDSSEFLGSPKFTRLKSMDELQPGDFMGNNSLGHWVIVAAPPANGKVIVYHSSGFPKVAGFGEISIIDDNKDGDNVDDGWNKGRWMRWKESTP